MALTNLFEMVKADRYTQDERDKIIEAQKEVEDVRYNIGDISQKTGLRKTANGWVDPKTGQKKRGSGAEQKTESKPVGESKPAAEVQQLNPAQQNAVKKLVSYTGKSEAEVYEIIKEMLKPRDEYEEKAEQKRRETFKAKEIEKVKKLEGLDINTFSKKLDEMGYEFAPRYNKKAEIVGGASWGTFGKNSADKPEFEYKYSKEKGIHNLMIRDAAPRVLTGDCKIKIRKSN